MPLNRNNHVSTTQRDKRVTAYSETLGAVPSPSTFRHSAISATVAEARPASTCMMRMA
jgi:hypothetical protein